MQLPKASAPSLRASILGVGQINTLCLIACVAIPASWSLNNLGKASQQNLTGRTESSTWSAADVHGDGVEANTHGLNMRSSAQAVELTVLSRVAQIMRSSARSGVDAAQGVDTAGKLRGVTADGAQAFYRFAQAELQDLVPEPQRLAALLTDVHQATGILNSTDDVLRAAHTGQRTALAKAAALYVAGDKPGLRTNALSAEKLLLEAEKHSTKLQSMPGTFTEGQKALLDDSLRPTLLFRFTDEYVISQARRGDFAMSESKARLGIYKSDDLQWLRLARNRLLPGSITPFARLIDRTTKVTDTAHMSPERLLRARSLMRDVQANFRAPEPRYTPEGVSANPPVAQLELHALREAAREIAEGNPELGLELIGYAESRMLNPSTGKPLAIQGHPRFETPEAVEALLGRLRRAAEVQVKTATK